MGMGWGWLEYNGWAIGTMGKVHIQAIQVKSELKEG